MGHSILLPAKILTPGIKSVKRTGRPWQFIAICFKTLYRTRILKSIASRSLMKPILSVLALIKTCSPPSSLFALQSDDDESLFSEVEDTEIDNGEEVGEEHNSRINGKEAEIRKYEPTEEEGSGLPQSKRMRLDADLDWRNDGYWSDRKQRHQEMKEHYQETCDATMTSEHSTTAKYPGNQHKEEAGNLGEGAE